MIGDLLQRQRALNHGSAGLWEGYAEHRVRVTELVLSLGEGRLVVLGAGNCNDLDLHRVLARFAEVHLVDVDEQALSEGAARQGVAGADGLVLHGGVDVTDPAWQRDTGIAAADAVVSAALLTQLLDTAEQAGQAGEQLLAVRDAHLRLLARLIGPHGTALLVTDVVSSDTCHRLDTAEPRQLAQLLVDSVNAGDFFTGTNPFAIKQRLAADPAIRARRTAVTAPWRWRMEQRSYLVCAVAFEPTPLS